MLPESDSVAVPMKNRAWPLMAIALVGAISFAATWWPRRFLFLYRLPGADKTGHFVVMGLLALVIVLSLSGTTWFGRRIDGFGWVMAVLAATAIEEATQLWISTRTFSWLDLAYSWAGVLLFGGTAALWTRRRGRRRDGSGEST